MKDFYKLNNTLRLHFDHNHIIVPISSSFYRDRAESIRIGWMEFFLENAGNERIGGLTEVEGGTIF